jgi:hypothetical protein
LFIVYPHPPQRAPTCAYVTRMKDKVHCFPTPPQTAPTNHYFPNPPRVTSHMVRYARFPRSYEISGITDIPCIHVKSNKVFLKIIEEIFFYNGRRFLWPLGHVFKKTPVPKQRATFTSVTVKPTNVLLFIHIYLKAVLRHRL